MRIAGLLVGIALLSLAASGRAADQDGGMTGGAPSKDDPPIETSSPKVKDSRNPDQPPARGPNPAKVAIIVFVDYENPISGKMRKAMRQIADEFPGDVRVEVRQIPEYGHPNSEWGALAAFAAHRQGKFWPMNDCLLEHQDSLDDLTFEACAAEAKLDTKRFAADRASDKLKDRMKAERDLVRSFGIMHAPAYTLNGRLYLGWGSWELFRGGVDEERRQVAALLKSGKKLPEAVRLRAKENVPKSPNALTVYTALIQNPPVTPKKKS